MAYERMNLQDNVDKWTAANIKHLEDAIIGLERALEPTKIMTVVIDLSDSNPDTCCSYEDDAVDMAAKSTDWDVFFGHYPVLVKNGIEVVKINPSDYTKDINGNAIDIESGNAGDVMIAFPRRGLNITTVDNKIRISFTNAYSDTNYNYYAHTHNGDLDTFYMGAYNGFIDDSGKLRSLSGKTPAHTITIGEARSAAQLNGSGYEQFAFYQLTYLQAMYIMKYKSLNGQTALGMGNVNSNAAIITGTMNDKGLDWGNITDKTVGMKFAGIENFWGNIFNWIDGIVTDSNCDYLTTTGTFNNSGEGYEYTIPCGIDDGGYLSAPIGTSLGGFTSAPDGYNGSSTTYFSDYSGAYAGCVAVFGGYWDDGLDAGPFYFGVASGASYADAGIGARVQKL